MEDVIRSYENAKEEERLSTNNARKVEYLTTIRAFESLIPVSCKVLDCAAGTGAYAFYLAEKGIDVTATDITPRHIEYINKQLAHKPYKIETAILDATNLEKFNDASFDIVLNMGPFYHLTENKDRNRCLQECLRVLKKGGLLITSYINKFYVFPYVATSDSRYINRDLAIQLYQTGVLYHDDPNCFWTDTYYASPEMMESYYESNDLEIIDHFAQDGISPMLRKVIDTWDENQFGIWCDYHYQTCREKSILGASNHAIIVGRK